MDPALADLLDRDAIRNVVHRLARGIDRTDTALVVSCYWPEAIDDHSHFIGDPAGFAAYAIAVTRSFATCQHHIATHTCELAGDEAFAETYYTFIGRQQQAPHFLSSGRYVDHFERRDGEWRIRNRVTVVEANYALDDSAVGGDVTAAYGPGERHPATLGPDDVSYHRPPQPRRPRAGR